MAFETPYRQLLPFSPFNAGLENANAIIAATSGTGKSVHVGKMLLTCARQDVQVSIIERGDRYYHPVTFMGGQMITMSLDSEQTINPFDLDAN
jgi:type IV secretory pathway VirB4 component